MMWRAAAFTLVLATIWWPEVSHYHLRKPAPVAASIEQLRSSPSDATLAKVAGTHFEPRTSLDPSQAVASARSILRGKWMDGDFGTRQLAVPLARNDLQWGWPTQQLRFASLAHVEVLLDAYEVTGELVFLECARDIVDAWAVFERSRVLPIGFLWNDHAVAQRVLVLTRYWSLLRGSRAFNPDSARSLLGFVQRSGLMLAKPGHFTVRTNHGVMQNLALLHVAAAFPMLPESSDFRRVAVERLQRQFAFYQSDEGVVLEHSPGYHGLGTNLLAALAGYEQILGEDLGLQATERLTRACRVLALLTRPDHTLPLIGNTGADPVDMQACTLAQGRDVARLTSSHNVDVFPVAGYLVGYGNETDAAGAGDVSRQVVVHWGNFATGAHKHDDEMGIVTWSRGRPFITGVGYWPYGHPLQRAALGWRGSNAPHFERDAPRIARQTILKAHGSSDSLLAADLQRNSTLGRDSIRRQLVQLGADLLLVVDYGESPVATRMTSVWTAYPGWSAEPLPEGRQFVLRDVSTGQRMGLSLGSAALIEAKVVVGNDAPFGGWVALGMAPESISRATSVAVNYASGTPVATAWSTLANVGQPAPARVRFVHWRGPDDWQVCFGDDPCDVLISRNAMHVQAVVPGGSQAVELVPGVDASPEVRAINDAYEEASVSYPFWRDFYSWRVQVTGWLLAAFALQELLLAWWRSALSNRVSVTLVRPAHHAIVALPAFWLAGGAYLAFVYFAA